MAATDHQVGGNHYLIPITPREYAKANKLGIDEFNVVKYVTRHKNKNGREDLLKAIHYLQMLLEDEYPET